MMRFRNILKKMIPGGVKAKGDVRLEMIVIRADGTVEKYIKDKKGQRRIK